jgi:hypothetical protein
VDDFVDVRASESQQKYLEPLKETERPLEDLKDLKLPF